MRRKRVGLVLSLSVVMAIIRTVIVTFNMEKNSYENDTYYLLDNAQSDIFSAALVVCIAVFIFLALGFGTGKTAVPDQRNDTVSGASCMLAFILLGTVIIYVVNLIVSETAVVDQFSIIVVVYSVLSAVSFLLTGLRVCSKKLLAVTALLPMMLTVFRLLNDFINTNSAPFASSGAYHIMSLAVLLLYFLCEGKAFLSRGSAVFYFMFGYGAVLLLSVYALPNLILHCFGVFNFDYHAAFSVTDIVTAVYICARLSSSKLKPLKRQTKAYN